MFTAFGIFMLIINLHLMSTALIVILSIIGLALLVAEGFVCGKITSELVHKKDKDLDEVLWFWLGFMLSFVAILLTLVVRPHNQNK